MARKSVNIEKTNMQELSTDSLIQEPSTESLVQSLVDDYKLTAAEEVSSESLLEDSVPVDEQVITQDEEELIREHNERIKKSAEYKALVVLNQYESNLRAAGRFMSGSERRKLHREFLRKAKKGAFDYMFDEEKIAKRQERDKAKFDKLNAPQRSVEELSDDTKAKLLEMVNEEPWHDTKPAIDKANE